MSASLVRLTGINSALALKAPVRCATTGPIALSGLQTIDGVTFQQSDVAFPNSGTNIRVLVKNQIDTTQNGIYIVNTAAWARAPDFDGNDDCVQGTRVYVAQGTSQSGLWMLTASDPVFITNSGNGVSSITFAQAPEQVASAAAATAAAASAVAAEGAMTTAIDPQFTTVAVAQTYSPAVAPDYIRTAFYDSNKVLGSGAMYRKVNSQPSHLGRLSITLQNSTVVWYEIAGDDVHIAQLGARMDGTTDDAAAVSAAQGVGRPVRFGPGNIRLASMLTISDTVPVWHGTGSSEDGATGNSRMTTLIGDHSGAAVIKVTVSSPSASARGLQINGMQITGKVSGPPNNQHGIIHAGAAFQAKYHDLTLGNLTGYGFAFDPTSNVYVQSMSLRDVFFHGIGGCLGLTQEPANSANYLACTFLRLDNIALEDGINTVSPQAYTWDFRAFRMIKADNFLNEGACPAGVSAVCAFTGNDGFNEFVNVWEEFTGTKPTFYAYFYANASGKFFSEAKSETRFRNVEIGTPFGVDAANGSFIHIRGLRNGQSSWSNIIQLGGTQCFVLFEDLIANIDLPNPPVYWAGKVEVRSFGNIGLNAAHYIPEKENTKVASWRPSGGDPTSFHSPFLAFAISNANVGTAIEVDDQTPHLQVYRATGNQSPPNPVFPSWTVSTPYDWWDVNLNYNARIAPFAVGLTLTGGASGAQARIVSITGTGSTGTLELKMLTAVDFQNGETITDTGGGSATANGGPSKIGPRYTLVVRYRMDWNTADGALVWTWNGNGSGITRDPTAVLREWQTLVIHFPAQSAVEFVSLALQGSPTINHNTIFRMASADLYLGRCYQEPFDLSYT